MRIHRAPLNNPTPSYLLRHLPTDVRSRINKCLKAFKQCVSEGSPKEFERFLQAHSNGSSLDVFWVASTIATSDHLRTLKRTSRNLERLFGPGHLNLFKAVFAHGGKEYLETAVSICPKGAKERFFESADQQLLNDFFQFGTKPVETQSLVYLLKQYSERDRSKLFACNSGNDPFSRWKKRTLNEFLYVTLKLKTAFPELTSAIEAYEIRECCQFEHEENAHAIYTSSPNASSLLKNLVQITYIEPSNPSDTLKKVVPGLVNIWLEKNDFFDLPKKLPIILSSDLHVILFQLFPWSVEDNLKRFKNSEKILDFFSKTTLVYHLQCPYVSVEGISTLIRLCPETAKQSFWESKPDNKGPSPILIAIKEGLSSKLFPLLIPNINPEVKIPGYLIETVLDLLLKSERADMQEAVYDLISAYPIHRRNQLFSTSAIQKILSTPELPEKLLPIPGVGFGEEKLQFADGERRMSPFARAFILAKSPLMLRIHDSMSTGNFDQVFTHYAFASKNTPRNLASILFRLIDIRLGKEKNPKIEGVELIEPFFVGPNEKNLQLGIYDLFKVDLPNSLTGVKFPAIHLDSGKSCTLNGLEILLFANASPVFKAAKASPEAKPFSFPNIPKKDFLEFLNSALYSKEVSDLSISTVLNILDLADFFKIESLKNRALAYISERLQPSPPSELMVTVINRLTPFFGSSKSLNEAAIIQHLLKAAEKLKTMQELQDFLGKFPFFKEGLFLRIATELASKK